MSRERHLIAIDLDGTLLDNDQKISKKNKKAIAQAVKDGHVVVIATGRPRRASIQYYHQLNLQTPMINFNGALIHHPTNTRWKSTHIPIEQTVAHKIRSEEHTSELQSRGHLVCRLLLEKKKTTKHK